MSLLFVGKSLSCIVATGTMGAVAVIPKIKSSLVSVEKDILDLGDLGEEIETFQQFVDVIETTTTTTEDKEKKIKESVGKIIDLLKKNGECKVNFVISEANKTYFRVVKKSDKIEDITLPIFTPQSKMGGKSKLERFAEDLENSRSSSESDKDKYSKYLSGFKERCAKNKNKFLRLHWRGQVFEQSTDSTIHSEDLGGLTNLWVDEKVNSKS